MPLPAGTGLDRRSFLLRSAGLALVVYGAAGGVRPEALEEGIAAAAAAAPDDRVLVSIFLEGGADPLALLSPAADGLYRSLRSRLALPESAGTAMVADGRYRWHPSARGLATLDREGKLGVLPGVGYLGSDQSHFTSRHYWEIGATDEGLGTGWLGRYLDRQGDPSNPVQGLSLDALLQPALAPRRAPVAALSLPELFRLQVAPQVQERTLDALAQMGRAYRKAPRVVKESARTGANAAALHRRIQPTGGGSPTPTSPPVPYPAASDEFPRRLAALAALLGEGLPIRCAALKAAGNFDSHANQQVLFDGDLRTTFDSLLAFERDLESRGLQDRVLVHVWSEFGRRAEDNASLGTDHGAAGIGFLIGSRVRSGLLSEYPSLDRLDEHGNLRATIDFRSVYRALLEQWLSADASDVLPRATRFAQPVLVR